MNIDELGIGGECEVGEAAAESDIPEYVAIIHAMMQPLWSSSRCC